jgi:hypothetical protein
MLPERRLSFNSQCRSCSQPSLARCPYHGATPRLTARSSSRTNGPEMQELQNGIAAGFVTMP